jgi:hypothetical protein
MEATRTGPKLPISCRRHKRVKGMELIIIIIIIIIIINNNIVTIIITIIITNSEIMLLMRYTHSPCVWSGLTGVHKVDEGRQ